MVWFFVVEEIGVFFFGMIYRLVFFMILIFMIVNGVDFVKMLNFFIGKFVNIVLFGEDLVILDYF